jgi:sugar phosphate permease
LVVGWSLTLLVVALTIFLPPGTWLALVVLLVLRFAFGGFQAGVFPGISRVVADWMPAPQRGFAQGSIWTFSRLGGAIAPVFVVWLITRMLGTKESPAWPASITLIAAVGLAWAAAFWLWFRNRPDEMSTLNSAELAMISASRPAVKDTAAEPVPWLAMLVSPSVWGLCLMYGFVGFAGNFVTQFLPVFLRDHRRLPDDTTAWLAGLPLAAGVISCLSGGVLSDWLIRRLDSRKWGRRLVGCLTLALAGVATFCTPWVHEVWQLAIVLAAWFFFNDGMLGPAWASCADIGERHAGTLSGAMNMTGAMCGAAGMALAGQLLHAHLYFLMFTVFAGSYFLAALCWFAVDVARPLALQPAGAK